jgi:hypothetical protein
VVGVVGMMVLSVSRKKTRYAEEVRRGHAEKRMHFIRRETA